ncbi:ABC transporter permease [Maledivibacter halophilus]|uniref:Peptide/nickel transport system permease protein n=1 Tax=Maledivibacter halophilus TaxID=36842 RepID=A0A1T5MPQ9_9FIRM|nr:ABC transporter permease [Maledivibacter halophilus]SKC90182.1 peptide/nickel transport system permease protein [Maledivibacter halophilus]
MEAKIDNKERSRIRNKKRSQWVEVLRRLKKNKAAMFGLFIIFMLIIVAIFADFITTYDYAKQNLDEALQSPSFKHFFGTDEFGRDIFTRIIYGSRISLLVGILAVGIAIFIGGGLGAIAGFYGGKLDNVIMRSMDVLLAIPSILLAISIVAALGSGLVNLMIAVGIANIPRYARIMRASILSVRDQEFIEASQSVGASDFTIIVKHIIPNCLAPVIVQGTLGVASAILSCAGLSFIGLGINPPTPEWGSMLSRGRDYLRDYWHVTAFPGMAIMITIFALNLFGDGLRDAFDPKLKN